MMKFLFLALVLGVMGGEDEETRIYFPSDTKYGNTIAEDALEETIREEGPNLVRLLTGEGFRRNWNAALIQGSSARRYVNNDAPPCAAHSPHVVLCEEDEEYDVDVMSHFDRAAKQANFTDGEMSKIFSDLMIDNFGSLLDPRTRDDEVVKNPVCPASEKIIFPKRGKTKDDTWVFLLNHGDIVQGVRVEECWKTTRLRNLDRSDRMECSVSTGTDVESVCEQKYVFKKMITVDVTGNELETESIWIPSCCVCMRKSLLKLS